MTAFNDVALNFSNVISGFHKRLIENQPAARSKCKCISKTRMININGQQKCLLVTFQGK